MVPCPRACEKRDSGRRSLGIVGRFPDLVYEVVPSVILKRGRSTMQQSQAMRIMAEKYEQLARASADPAERRRLYEYIKLYRDMEMHFAEAESAQRARERRD